MKLILKRLGQSATEQIGTLYLENGAQVAVTMEPPWKDNRQNVSCIPAGNYVCRMVETTAVNTADTGISYEVQNVKGRSGIFFHVGNFASDTRGCILVGRKFGGINGEPMIVNSRAAYKEFLAAVGFETKFNLEIQNTKTVKDTKERYLEEFGVDSQKNNKKMEQIPTVEHEVKVKIPFYVRPAFKRSVSAVCAGSGFLISVIGHIGLIPIGVAKDLSEKLFYMSGVAGVFGVGHAAVKSQQNQTTEKVTFWQKIKGLLTQLINFLKLLINLRSNK